MAGLFCKARSDEITLVTSSGWNTALQIAAPSNHRVRILSWGISCRGTTNSDKPIKARLVRQSDAGTGGVSATAGKQNTGFSETPQSTLLSGPWATTEPTSTGEALDEKTVHPQAGIEIPTYERGQIELAGGERVAIQYDNESGGSSIGAIFDINFEE